MSVAQNHFTKDETLVIGDPGVETALVLTGEATRKDAQLQAGLYFYDVRELRSVEVTMVTGTVAQNVSTGSICVPCKKSESSRKEL